MKLSEHIVALSKDYSLLYEGEISWTDRKAFLRVWQGVARQVAQLEAENVELKRVSNGLLWLNNNIHHYGTDEFLGYLKDAIQDALLTAEETQ